MYITLLNNTSMVKTIHPVNNTRTFFKSTQNNKWKSWAQQTAAVDLNGLDTFVRGPIPFWST
jgi:hypothetical protein